MKAAVYKGIGEFEVTDVPVIEPEDEQLLLKIDYCSICGSDLHSYKHGVWTAPGTIMGHEYAGTVAKLGPGTPPDIQVGDRITVCNLTPCGVCDKCANMVPHLCPNMRGAPGGYAEYATPAKPGTLKMFYKLPDNVSTLEGAMIEPLSVGVRAAKMAKYRMNSTVVVFGAGTIGLCTMQAARTISGASTIIQIDISQKRLDLAKELGADYIINAGEVDDVFAAIQEITGPVSQPYGHPGLADVVLECAGSVATLKLAQEVVNAGGTLVSVALPESAIEIDMPMLIQKEVTWKGSYAYIYDFEESIALLASGKVQLKPLVSDIYKLDDINEAFARQMDTKNSIKVLMDCRS
jgi:threonine dehydrogenase-like Zn-dependent dehydrogenase